MDPRIVPHEHRSANLSPLMKALSKARTGQVVPACPFGCTVAQMDERGHCHHLIGFTTDPVKGPIEPLRFATIKRKGADGKVETVETEYTAVVGAEKEPLRKGDKLIRVTSTYRVYRKSGGYRPPVESGRVPESAAGPFAGPEPMVVDFDPEPDAPAPLDEVTVGRTQPPPGAPKRKGGRRKAVAKSGKSRVVPSAEEKKVLVLETADAE